MSQYQKLVQRIEELERRMGQMVIRGKIAEVDPAKHVARVAYGSEGKQLTGWLQWKPSRTGGAITWWCPEVSEGVTVISEGDLALGEILPGSYHAEFPAPSSNPDEYLVCFGDGSRVSHNRSTHKMVVVNQGDVIVNAEGAITVETKQTLTVKAASNMQLTTDANMVLKAEGNIELIASRIDFN